MSAPSLRDIENTLTTLWMDEEARCWFLSGAKLQTVPAALKDIPLDFIKTISQDGVRLYGSLLNFGHHDVMESIYPYCKQLLADDWEETVDDYLKVFPPDHFNFNRLCSRFSRYFDESERGRQHRKKFPFIAELAHYEWIELEKMEEDVLIEEFSQESLVSPESFAKLAPAVNPSLTIARYKYPLTQIVEILEAGGKLSRKISQEETIVAIYRNPETHRCHFVELGEATAQMLEKAVKSTVSYQDLIPLVVSLAKDTDPQKVVVTFLDSIEELQELKVLVGSKKVG
jgi:hypothetical protein